MPELRIARLDRLSRELATLCEQLSRQSRGLANGKVGERELEALVDEVLRRSAACQVLAAEEAAGPGEFVD